MTKNKVSLLIDRTHPSCAPLTIYLFPIISDPIISVFYYPTTATSVIVKFPSFV